MILIEIVICPASTILINERAPEYCGSCVSIRGNIKLEKPGICVNAGIAGHVKSGPLFAFNFRLNFNQLTDIGKNHVPNVGNVAVAVDCCCCK